MSKYLKSIVAGSLVYSVLFMLISSLNLNDAADMIGVDFFGCDTSLNIEWPNAAVYLVFLFLLMAICSSILSFISERIGYVIQSEFFVLLSSMLVFLFNLYAVAQLEGAITGACSWFLGKVIMGSAICSALAFILVRRQNA